MWLLNLFENPRPPLSLFASINQICHQNDHLFGIILAQAIYRITITLLLSIYPEGHSGNVHVRIHNSDDVMHLHNLVVLCAVACFSVQKIKTKIFICTHVKFYYSDNGMCGSYYTYYIHLNKIKHSRFGKSFCLA